MVPNEDCKYGWRFQRALIDRRLELNCGEKKSRSAILFSGGGGWGGEGVLSFGQASCAVLLVMVCVCGVFFGCCVVVVCLFVVVVVFVVVVFFGGVLIVEVVDDPCFCSTFSTFANQYSKQTVYVVCLILVLI